MANKYKKFGEADLEWNYLRYETNEPELQPFVCIYKERAIDTACTRAVLNNRWDSVADKVIIVTRAEWQLYKMIRYRNKQED